MQLAPSGSPPLHIIPVEVQVPVVVSHIRLWQSEFCKQPPPSPWETQRPASQSKKPQQSRSPPGQEAPSPTQQVFLAGTPGGCTVSRHWRPGQHCEDRLQSLCRSVQFAGAWQVLFAAHCSRFWQVLPAQHGAPTVLHVPVVWHFPLMQVRPALHLLSGRHALPSVPGPPLEAQVPFVQLVPVSVHCGVVVQQGLPAVPQSGPQTLLAEHRRPVLHLGVVLQQV